MDRISAGAVVAAGLALWATPAEAHIELLSPPARYSPDQQKTDPCGHPENPPGKGPPTVFEAGQTITIEFDEFVQHPGHFRVAVDPTGTDAFTSPMAFDDFYNSPEVIADDIPDMQNGGVHSVEVTLPDTPCNPCTLQLIQVMTGDGVFGPGNDDLYFQCADIVLEPRAGVTTEATTGSDSSGGADTTGGSGPGPGDTTSTGGDMPGGDDDPDGGPGSGEDTGPGAGSTGSQTTADSDADDGGGCGCRSHAPAGAAPWLLVVLAARRRAVRPAG